MGNLEMEISNLSGSEQGYVVLYDLNGKKLKEQLLNGMIRNEMAVPRLVNGVYLLHIRNEWGTRVIKVPVVFE